MKYLSFPIFAKRKDLKQLLYLAIIILVLAIAGYFIVTNWQFLTEILPKLPAGIFVLFEKDQEMTEEDILDEEERLEEKEEKYLERAEKGEGMTHLARRALKKYLQENPQDFEVTTEHKIYIEDYINKKLGGSWLELGQEIEISLELIEKAIEKSSELSLQQLDNLSQYSQFVSF